MTPDRIILVGPPRSGKSTLARELRAAGTPTFCGDPAELVKDLEAEVTYLPSGLGWSEASQYVAETWFRMPGPWCCEGVSMVRALRKVLDDPDRVKILDGVQIVRFTMQYESAVTKEGQRAMAKAIDKIWNEIVGVLPGKVTYL